MSVRLSLTRRYCVETAKTSSHFSPPGGSAILVFRAKRYGKFLAILRRDPISGTSNTGGMKNRDFLRMSRFISEMIRGRAIDIMHRQQKLVCDLSNGAIPMSLSDLK